MYVKKQASLLSAAEQRKLEFDLFEQQQREEINRDR